MQIPVQKPGLRNPYYHTAIVHDPRLFFGRQSVLRRFYTVVRDRQCLSLVGPRRIGKSSVLNALRRREVQERLGSAFDEHILAYVDTSAQPLKSYEDLLEFMGEQLVAQNADRLSALRAHPKRDASQFRQFLEQIKVLGLYPVLLLDEFEYIAGARQFEPDFFSFLRAQANIGMISYIIASKDTLDKVCHADLVGSPFFNIFSTLRLGPLSDDEARELIMVPSQEAGIRFSPSEITWVLDIAGRHPFFIQRTCHVLFEAKSAQPATELDLLAIERLAYAELLPHFDYAWRHLGGAVEEQLAWEARREGVSRRSVPEFSDSRLFRRFICDERGIDLATITVEYLNDLLDDIDDVLLLGKSTLGYLNIIYLQSSGATLSAVERGLMVQRLLLACIDELRLDMQQKKDEAQLRLYQILVLRVKEQLRNEQIAARLAISNRHFFRERPKAVKALLNVLLKKEQLSKNGPSRIFLNS